MLSIPRPYRFINTPIIMYARTSGKKIIRSTLPTLRPPDVDPPSAHAYFEFNVPLYIVLPELADCENFDTVPIPFAFRSHTKVILDDLQTTV